MDAIRVSRVSKSFSLQNVKYGTLKEKILFKGRSESKQFHALQNVSFSIEQGETVALMGRNGSGKSTLLKILSKIIYPTSGEVEVNGRVSSLLELGAGFHPEFTGRENIYMNASILGLSKKDIDAKLDEIIAFSELEEFIDRTVRVYSSGMYMRLAFSIAISVDPDILLIDEVLAVGDSAFQNKCINKINELRGKGKTIVIVTHDNGVVEKLCDRAVWLQQGKIMEIGRPKDIIVKYLSSLAEMENDRLIQEETKRHEAEDNTKVAVERQVRLQEIDSWGNKFVEITKVDLMDRTGVKRKSFTTGDTMDIQISYKVNKPVKNAVFGIGIFTLDNVCCYGTNTSIDKHEILDLAQSGNVRCKIHRLMLVPNEYFLDVAIQEESGEPYDYQTRQIKFQVNSDIGDIGISRQEHEWEIEK